MRPYVERHHSEWIKQLFLDGFVANNAMRTTTKYIPFILNYGGHPIVPFTFLGTGKTSQMKDVLGNQARVNLSDIRFCVRNFPELRQARSLCCAPNAFLSS